MTFGIGPNGLVVGNQEVATPAGEGLKVLNSALAPSGVSLRLVGQVPLRGGGEAQVLEVEIRSQNPPPGFPPSVTRLRFGGAASWIERGEGPAVIPPVAEEAPPLSAPAAPATGGSDPNPSEPAPAPAPAPVVRAAAEAPTAGAPFVDRSSVIAMTGGAVPPGETTAAAALAPVGSNESVEAQPAAFPIVRPRRIGAGGLIYGALLATGLVMLAIASLWRGKGVGLR
jgi:hypothetical protein